MKWYLYLTNNNGKRFVANYYNEKPEWKGKRVVMSGCITENPNELGKLLVEDIHFIIEN